MRVLREGEGGGLGGGDEERDGGGVDGDVDVGEGVVGVMEEGGEVLGWGEVGLEDGSVEVLRVDRGEGVVGIG
ncbi:hypothetical protein, partial [Corynebacterium glyciniphilum]|uniref:hypothetical protein n=1 Tax=Corynebacterium glyciniphilum TaxID=1404244 RepID=UPI001C92C97B